MMTLSAVVGPVSQATGPTSRDRGSVTVEAALGICSIVAALVLGVAAAGLVIGQLRCTDAANEAARLVARGERDRASQAVAAVAPSGADLTVTVQGDEITAEVRSRAPGGLIPGQWLRARAYAVLEPAGAPTEPGGSG